ncbi:sterile alpha motif-like domain-containing protein (plasmid) [Streptomyces sp. NBC_00390]|uniref:YozE family protein n=1 Tax=Streptomyces sp. NBC_00390 TaxID=2975736 RepID=UPI002E23EDBC
MRFVDDQDPIGDLARDVRDDAEWPEFDEGVESLRLYNEYLEDCGAVDGALEALDDAWHLYQNRWAWQQRQRQLRELKDIRAYCDLEDLGVRLYLDDRVRYRGREGTIADTAGRYLLVLLDGEQRPTRCHPTANMEYETNAGWVKPPPRPPFAAAPGRGQ